MSKAYECDRCGILFKPYKNQKTSRFLNIGCLDLCPKCNDKLQEWIENGKTREEESITSQEPKIRYCKDCKWWKDSDGSFRRGIGAESKCHLNTDVVYEGLGYCYMFEPLVESEEE